MAVKCLFHPEALLEFQESACFYARTASEDIAERFVTEVEGTVAEIEADPVQWRVVEPPDLRRCLLDRFPFVIWYRIEAEFGRATIYAVMHCSREPLYWTDRLE